MARFERGNDATAARKLARSEPLSGRNSRSDVTPRLSHIEKLKPGDDPTDAINRLYSVGRRTYGQPMPDAPRERTPHHQAPQPDWSSERATYAIGKNSPVSPAPDESQPQFADDKVATHNDASGWVRGMGGQSPHPHFDSGPSGSRYRK